MLRRSRTITVSLAGAAVESHAWVCLPQRLRRLRAEFVSHCDQRDPQRILPELLEWNLVPAIRLLGEAPLGQHRTGYWLRTPGSPRKGFRDHRRRAGIVQAVDTQEVLLWVEKCAALGYSCEANRALVCDSQQPGSHSKESFPGRLSRTPFARRIITVIHN